MGDGADLILVIIFGFLIFAASHYGFIDLSKNPLNTLNKTSNSPGVMPNLSNNYSAGSCDPSLWNHVYNPRRLQIIDNCTSVTGTIKLIRKEADGDYHIQLTLDKQYANLLNDKNINDQAGSLVLEPVCVNKVTQTDALDACNGFVSNVAIPVIGQHVQVIGSYVLDKDHGWMEIHPVSRIIGA